MGYENEIKHLMRELEIAKSAYLKARLNSEDALRIHAFKTDVETIEFQIDVFEKADKTNEYKTKAEAFDETIEILKELRDFNEQTEPHSQRMKEKRRNYVQFCDEVLREIKLSYKEIIDEYESGERNERD